MSLVVDIEKKLGGFLLRSKFETGSGTMALLGASGCGKSVTLKCIAGIMTPDKGRIVLDGETLFDSEKHIDLTPQRRQVGYLFQQYALFPNMTVLQNIQGEKQQRASEQLRRFRLEGLEKKYPAQLSGGQQQRVALARILASDPRAILLDEPFSALDGFLKWNLEMELADFLSDFSGPILWVSHDLGECFRSCRSVCIMDNGASLPVTDMETLVHHPATQCAARLVGLRNFLPGRRCEGGVRIDGWEMVLPLQAASEQVTVAVPESAIVLAREGYTARVCRVIRDLRDTVAVLRPVQDADAQLLRVVLPEGMAVAEGDVISFALLADQCLQWEQ